MLDGGSQRGVPSRVDFACEQKASELWSSLSNTPPRCSHQRSHTTYLGPTSISLSKKIRTHSSQLCPQLRSTRQAAAKAPTTERTRGHISGPCLVTRSSITKQLRSRRWASMQERGSRVVRGRATSGNPGHLAAQCKTPTFSKAKAKEQAQGKKHNKKRAASAKASASVASVTASADNTQSDRVAGLSCLAFPATILAATASYAGSSTRSHCAHDKPQIGLRHVGRVLQKHCVHR